MQKILTVIERGEYGDPVKHGDVLTLDWKMMFKQSKGVVQKIDGGQGQQLSVDDENEWTYLLIGLK